MSVTSNIVPYQKKLDGLIAQLNGMIPSDKMATFIQDAAQLKATHTSPLKLHQGDKAPMFTLTNATGKPVSLEKVLQEAKVVMTFYRGTWCPYCNLALNSYQEVLPQIKEAGAEFIAISPQTPDQSLSIAEKNALEFEVLSDPGNVVAKQFTAVFRNGDQPVKAMNDLGIDFYSFYSDKSGELPVPAVFIIDKDGTIIFAKSEGGDYRHRVEPQEILDALG